MHDFGLNPIIENFSSIKFFISLISSSVNNIYSSFIISLFSIRSSDIFYSVLSNFGTFAFFKI